MNQREGFAAPDLNTILAPLAWRLAPGTRNYVVSLRVDESTFFTSHPRFASRIVIKVTCEAGHSFLDRMIALVEGSERQKTPNEKALGVLLISLTLIFILVTFTLPAFTKFLSAQGLGGSTPGCSSLVALLVCLIPTTIGGLVSAIGISGIDRLTRQNVLATSGRAVEAAGDVDVLLLDKTGTITLGNRQASEFIAAPGVDARELAETAQLSSLADETPEGRSVVVLAKQLFAIRGRELATPHAVFVPFTAETRMASRSSAAFANGPPCPC